MLEIHVMQWFLGYKCLNIRNNENDGNSSFNSELRGVFSDRKFGDLARAFL